MCGIAGFYGMRNGSLLKKMTGIIAHRGPDDEGFFSDDLCSLGHRRLSIIDLSKKGHQPMKDATGRYTVTYNGEIYNFQEIRNELLELGYQFKSRTDTEVILCAYREWGTECLKRFNGMFAFALWDSREQSLFIARDRVGIKPLYYAVRDNIILFASEIKSILCWNKIERKVNIRSLDYYFTFRYNHLDETLFQGIRKLPPGHYLTARRGKKGSLALSIEKYWDIDQGKIITRFPEASDSLAHGLAKSIDYQMISDVPLGVFLSSGVDSSTVAGIMKREFTDNVKTFTVGFDYPGHKDEIDQVRFTSGYFKTDHTEYICKPDVVSLFPRMLWHCDELNADPALIPTYLISEIAGKKVKVVLSGEGSDELFGGYERTLLMKYAWNISRYSPGLLNLSARALSLVPGRILDIFFKYSSSLGSKGIGRLSSFCRNIKNIGESYLDVASVFNQDDKKHLYTGALRDQLRDEHIADSLNTGYFSSSARDEEELVYSLLRFELKTRMVNDLMTKLDTMTMAHSLEGRVPYLDHNLVEFAMSISSKLKIRLLRDKYILRKAAGRYIPREILERKKDHFFVPIHLWLKNDLSDVINRILTPDNINKTGFLDAGFITMALENYKKGQLYYARQIWNLLSFLIWHRIFIETDTWLSMGKERHSLDMLYP